MSPAARLLCATLAAILASSTALATEPPGNTVTEARTHFERGVKLAGEERWAEAEQAFAESEALVPRASTAYDRALALYRLGRLREMLVELDRFVAWSDPTRDADDRVAAERLRQSAEATLGALTVTVTPRDATLEVDRDELRGDGERSLRLDPGEHVVVARAHGFRDAHQTVRIAAGEHAALSLALEATPPAPVPAPVPTTQPPPPEPAPRRPARSYTLPIALGVLGGVSLAGAAVTGVLASHLDGQIRARCRGTECPADLSDDQSRMWALAMTSDGLLIAGAGLIGASVTLWLLTPKSPGERTARLSLSPTGAGLGGTF